MGACWPAHPCGQAWGWEATCRHTRGDEWRHVRAEHGMPMALPSEGLAAAQYGELLLWFVELGRDAGSHSACAGKNPAATGNRNRQAIGSGERLRGVATALDCRTNFRMAQSMSSSRQRLGKSVPQRPRLPQARIDPPHAAKALQSLIMSRD